MFEALIPYLMQLSQNNGGQLPQGYGGTMSTRNGLGGSMSNPSGASLFGGILGGPMGAAGMGLGAGLLRSLFGGGKSGGGDFGSNYLNQIAPTITPYYDPYITAGKQAMGTLMPEYTNLISDPTAKLSAIGANYKASPGYQYNVNQATNAANQAAAAGGMLGSPAEQQSLAQNISGLASQDYNQFVQNALGLYGQGLGGMGNINQMGFNASNALAENLAQALNSQAQLEYAKQANRQQQGGGWLNKIIGGLF